MTDEFSALRIRRELQKAKRANLVDAVMCIAVFAVYWAWLFTR